MTELDVFINKIIEITEGKAGELDDKKSRKIINEMNSFLFTTHSDIGNVKEFGQSFAYFSEFHKYWHKYSEEILNLTIDDTACELVADELHEVYIRTKGKAFLEVYDTNELSDEDVCRVRLLTANQDFRGSRSFKVLSDLYKASTKTFDEKWIFSSPEDFVKSIGITGLSQNDKRVQYAKNISKFLIENKCTPYEIIDIFEGDVFALRTALIQFDGSGFGYKKADMFIRDMVVLGVWSNVLGFEKIDVASDINTIKVALRTGILKSDIPLVSSFLDIFGYQYTIVDKMNALAWRRVWEIWNKKYPKETIVSPCLLDYFIYNVIGKQFCQPKLCLFECEDGHRFYWHSSRNRTCQICNDRHKDKKRAFLLSKMLPCESEDGYKVIEKTGFVLDNLADPNYSKCPFENICIQYGNKKLMPPKSISIMGQTGWTSAYVDEGEGGGGLMA